MEEKNYGVDVSPLEVMGKMYGNFKKSFSYGFEAFVEGLKFPFNIRGGARYLDSTPLDDFHYNSFPFFFVGSVASGMGTILLYGLYKNTPPSDDGVDLLYVLGIFTASNILFESIRAYRTARDQVLKEKAGGLERTLSENSE